MKGINLLNCLYYSQGVSLPVAFELVKKPIQFCDIHTQQEKRKSDITKNEQLRNMLNTCSMNQLKWRYVLADSWFASCENMSYIHEKLGKLFIFALKSNRLIALTKEDKAEGRYTRIDSIEWSEEPVQGWVKGLDFPLIFHRQIFTNKDGSTGILYLISNDIHATKKTLETIYQKRWKVEVFHKNMKSNASMAKSPARTVRTQSNHIFMSIYAAARLENLSVKKGLSTFALKTKLYIRATQQAFEQLKVLRADTA